MRFSTALLGPMAHVGQGFTYTDYNRVHPRVERQPIGLQRELSNNMMIEASYWGQWGDRIPPSSSPGPLNNVRLDALPQQYWASGNTRNNAIATELNRNVPNPFHISNFESIRTSDPTLYQHMSTLSQFTSSTIQKNRLLRPFPHMNGLYNATDPSGKARTHAFEANFQRRFSRGLNLNASYTGMLQENLTSSKTSLMGAEHRVAE